MLNRIFSKTPLPSMTYGLIERVLSPSRLNEIFEQTAEKQYTKDLLFSEVCSLLLRVVLKEKSSIHVSYRESEEAIGASLTAVYDKLNKVEPTVSAALVSRTYEDLRAIQQSMGYQSQALLPGYTTRLLDGNTTWPPRKNGSKPSETPAAGPYLANPWSFSTQMVTPPEQLGSYINCRVVFMLSFHQMFSK